MQHVFLRLWQTPGAFDVERGSLRSHLMMMTRSRAIDLVCSGTSRRNKDHAVQQGGTLRENGLSSTLATRFDHDAKDMLVRLPTAQREAISLASLGGYTYRGVPQALGQPEGTIKSRIRAGLVRLHTFITEDGPPDRPPC